MLMFSNLGAGMSLIIFTVARYTSEPKLVTLCTCNSLVVIFVLSCIKELYETVGEQYPPVQQQPCQPFSAN